MIFKLCQSPFNLTSKRSALNQMNEFDLIQSYFNWEITDPSIELGVGDDAALFNLNPGHQLVTSTDTLVEGIHSLKTPHPVTLLINL